MSEQLMQRKPKWLRVKLPTGAKYKHVRKLVSDNIVINIIHVSYAMYYISTQRNVHYGIQS